MEDGRNRRNGARVHRIEHVLSENTTMGPRFSNRNAVLNPKSNLEVRSEPQSRAQRRIDELQRGPIVPFSAITGPPCQTDFPEHNNKSKGAVCLAGPWSVAHGSRVMILQFNNPMAPLATIALRSYSPKAQVQSCPISLGISPSPTLRINLACLGRKKSARRKKPPGWVAFKVSMVSEAGFEPARPVCGH